MPKRKRSNAKLGPFEVGQIISLHAEGYSNPQICLRALKADGSAMGREAVRLVLRKRQEQPRWTGERQAGSGRPRATTLAADKAAVQEVLKHRGSLKITSGKVRVRVRGMSKVSPRTVRRRLVEAHLRWLRRRRKTLVPETSRKTRKTWARWVRRLPAKTLRRWVYTDGVSFYLDRDEAEAEDKQRGALGLYVWRCTEQRDALFHDCVGPSTYSKGQGERVVVWGLLVNGHLHISVLDRGSSMNRWEYQWLVWHRFSRWLAGTSWPLLVQDHERALWCPEPLAAFRSIGVEVVARHPKHSPDLNAIENAWQFLRSRLDDTRRPGREGREPFLVRLRAAVAWINKNHGPTLRKLCRNQRLRASDVLAQDGFRTKW